MSSGGPPGGKGGKSLDLMKQRLGGQAEPAPVGEAPTGSPAAPAAGVSGDQRTAQAATPFNNPNAINPNAGGRPKGKNFAAMAKNAGARQSPVPAPVVAAPVPMAGSTAVGKPKGKDFSAMASRMPPQQQQPLPPPPQQQQYQQQQQQQRSQYPPTHQGQPGQQQRMGSPQGAQTQAQRERAFAMQAAARAAAGLPPLEQPTATSVSTVPPPIQMAAPGTRISSTASKQGQVQPVSYVDNSSVNSVAAQTQAGARIQSTGVRRASSSGNNQPSPSNQRTSTGHPGHSQAAATAAQLQQKQQLVQQQAAQQQRLQQQKAVQQQRQFQEQRKRQQQQQQAASARPTPQPSLTEARLSSQTRAGAPHMAPLVGERIADLVKSLDPNYTIDTAAEEQLLQLADDFLDQVTRQSMRMASHRGSKTMDVQDLQLVLAKQWGIVVPGLGAPTFRPSKSAKSSTASSGGAKRRASESNLAAGGSKSKKANTSGSVPQQT